MDYARFLAMLAQGGQLDGQRLLARTTVRHMTTDHLGDIKPATPQLAPGYGFGLGFARRFRNIPGVAHVDDLFEAVRAGRRGTIFDVANEGGERVEIFID